MLNQTIAVFTLLDLGKEARWSCGIVSRENYQDKTHIFNYTAMLYKVPINNTKVTISKMRFTIILITKPHDLLV